MANRRFDSDRVYNFSKKLVLLTAKFKIDAAAGDGVDKLAAPGAGGFGQPNSANTGFGTGIKQVFGYCSGTPTTGNNTLSGNLAIQLQDNYLAFLGMDYTLGSAVTGSNILVSTGFTLGQLYQITALGTSTTANWQTVGVPAGVTPAVGMVFQASTASAGTGNGTAKALASSNLTHLEVAGDPNLTIQPVGQASGFNGGAGGWIYLNCFKTATLTQPTDGCIVWIDLWLEGR